MFKVFPNILLIPMIPLNRKWRKEEKIDQLPLQKWMLARVVLIQLFQSNLNNSKFLKEKNVKNYQLFIWLTWQVARKLVKLEPQEIVWKKQQESTNLCQFWDWLFQLWQTKQWEKEKVLSYLTETLAWLVSYKMHWEVTQRLWWFVLYRLQLTITKKLYQHLDMLIKQKRFKIKL